MSAWLGVVGLVFLGCNSAPWKAEARVREADSTESADKAPRGALSGDVDDEGTLHLEGDVEGGRLSIDMPEPTRDRIFDSPVAATGKQEPGVVVKYVKDGKTYSNVEEGFNSWIWSYVDSHADGPTFDGSFSFECTPTPVKCFSVTVDKGEHRAPPTTAPPVNQFAFTCKVTGACAEYEPVSAVAATNLKKDCGGALSDGATCSGFAYCCKHTGPTATARTYSDASNSNSACTSASSRGTICPGK